ncbi:hypothetical protein GCM10008018_67530 [Paenibacillus marchantiophytorum]|uniref:DUF3955 domain-containing protein n=1 Tax=Paenibacillus marchantiophytorum TaxID=1619310 RepID=A0ABQ1FH99_9BACL|nr:hypothetical protein GCM10008018_67530 [Paenibacillus marchantiophytorum]
MKHTIVTLIGIAAIIMGVILWRFSPNGPGFEGLGQAIFGFIVICIGLLLLFLALILWIRSYKYK